MFVVPALAAIKRLKPGFITDIGFPFPSASVDRVFDLKCADLPVAGAMCFLWGRTFARVGGGWLLLVCWALVEWHAVRLGWGSNILVTLIASSNGIVGSISSTFKANRLVGSDCLQSSSRGIFDGTMEPHRVSVVVPLVRCGVGSTGRTYTTSLTKTKAAKYDLPGIEDMVPNLWSPVKVSYGKHALLGTSQWGPKRQRFYRYASNRVSKHDVYSTKRIFVVTNVKVKEWYGYGHLKEIEV
ncbi:hypothetical protein Tco_0111717 [Tanacetum coccineum]